MSQYPEFSPDGYCPPIEYFPPPYDADLRTINPQSFAQHLFFKTRRCKAFDQGSCQYGNNCQFAHGHEELRQPPPGWQNIIAQPTSRAKICNRFYNGEVCTYGDRCSFLHVRQNPQVEGGGTVDFRGPSLLSCSDGAGNGGKNNLLFKTKLCHKYEKNGQCPYGEKCQYAHGMIELRNSESCEVVIRPNLEREPAKFSEEPTAIVSPIMAEPVQQTQEKNEKLLKWKSKRKLVDIYADWITEPMQQSSGCVT